MAESAAKVAARKRREAIRAAQRARVRAQRKAIREAARKQRDAERRAARAVARAKREAARRAARAAARAYRHDLRTDARAIRRGAEIEARARKAAVSNAKYLAKRKTIAQARLRPFLGLNTKIVPYPRDLSGHAGWHTHYKSGTIIRGFYSTWGAQSRDRADNPFI